jgi:hypothetical protein
VVRLVESGQSIAAAAHDHRFQSSIRVQCEVLAESGSGFRQHMARQKKIDQRRHLTKEALLAHIRAVYAEYRGAYGWPRIRWELLARGVRVGRVCSGSSDAVWITEGGTAAWRAVPIHSTGEGRSPSLAVWYNTERMHSTLNYVSPVEFESNWKNALTSTAA